MPVEVPESLPAFEALDPLSQLRRRANKICEKLQARNTYATINILGCYHGGVIGEDIRDEISRSDIITTELPSQVVNEAKNTGGNLVFLQNSFWVEILDTSCGLNKNVFGVNNNRSAVNALRVLRGSIKPEKRVFERGPHLVITLRSLDSLDMGIRKLLNIPDIRSSAQPSLVTIDSPELIQEVNRKAAAGEIQLPFNGNIEGQDGEVVSLHFLRAAEDKSKLQVLICTNPWSTPLEFLIRQTPAIMSGYEDLFPNTYAFVDNGLQHLMRLRVDKTQVDGIITAIDKHLNRWMRGGSFHKPLNITHIGGLAHNPNLLAILRNIFNRRGVVLIVEKRDGRSIPISFTADTMTFFSEHVPIKDGLLSTGIFYDQTLINLPEATRVLKSVVETKREEVQKLWLFEQFAEQIIDKYKLVRMHEDGIEFDIIVVNYLLSLIVDDCLAGRVKLPDITSAFPEDLALFIQTHFPELNNAVGKAMGLFMRRKEKFPRSQ